MNKEFILYVYHELNAINELLKADSQIIDSILLRSAFLCWLCIDSAVRLMEIPLVVPVSGLFEIYYKNLLQFLFKVDDKQDNSVSSRVTWGLKNSSHAKSNFGSIIQNIPAEVLQNAKGILQKN